MHQALRLAIIEQSLRAGDKLPEDAIGETFGTSRTIAREALNRLATEGLVDLKPNRGAFVAHPSLEEGRDIFAVRQGLERLVIELLAGQLSASAVKALRNHVKQEVEASGKDEVRSVRLAGEFHILLAALTGNQLLLRYMTEVVSRCSLILAMYSRPHSSECGVNEHAQIIEALVAGDAAAAVRLMNHHLHDVSGRALEEEAADHDLRKALAPYAADAMRAG